MLPHMLIVNSSGTRVFVMCGYPAYNSAEYPRHLRHDGYGEPPQIHLPC